MSARGVWWSVGVGVLVMVGRLLRGRCGIAAGLAIVGAAGYFPRTRPIEFVVARE